MSVHVQFVIFLVYCVIKHNFFVSAVVWAGPIKGGMVCIGSISRFVCKVILYLCAKVGAFITKMHNFIANPLHYNHLKMPA